MYCITGINEYIYIYLTSAYYVKIIFTDQSADFLK